MGGDLDELLSGGNRFCRLNLPRPTPRHVRGRLRLPCRENALREAGVCIGKAALHPGPRVFTEAGLRSPPR
jgi:hypothetical protein